MKKRVALAAILTATTMSSARAEIYSIPGELLRLGQAASLPFQGQGQICSFGMYYYSTRDAAFKVQVRKQTFTVNRPLAQSTVIAEVKALKGFKVETTRYKLDSRNSEPIDTTTNFYFVVGGTGNVGGVQIEILPSCPVE